MDDRQKGILLTVAKQAVETAVNGHPLPVLETIEDPVLLAGGGCFVTLKNNGQLRGCVGSFAADKSLIEMVGQMAISSVRNDLRFTHSPINPAELMELEIEISVLSPMFKTDDPLSLELDKHGIFITDGRHSGCLLPQVASESDWTKEEFLNYCCMQRAGLPDGAWKDPKVEVYLFTAEVFGAKWEEIGLYKDAGKTEVVKVDSSVSSKVALIIIYNHRYDKNIDVLERVYKNKFSHIYHLMPFYDGDKPNVIPVHENSHYFQGYIAQGLKSFYRKEYKHYIFIADDLLLNPAINEKNYQEILCLEKNSCFVHEFISFHKLDWFWLRSREAYEYRVKKEGVEILHQIPNYDEALVLFAKHGLEIKPLTFCQICSSESLRVSPEEFAVLRGRNSEKRYPLAYPLVGGYSDICIVSADSIRKFCHYCGVFAATDLFVEVAIPTAIALSAKKIILDKDAKLHGKPIWSKEDLSQLRDQYSGDLKSLLNNFPPEHLYLHPIKLSKWKTDF